MLNLKFCFIYFNIGFVSFYFKMLMILFMILSIYVFCIIVEYF